MVVLHFAGAAEGRPDLEARIAPAAGGNLFSLRSGELELLQQARRMADLSLQRAGTPILFPTPNRVSGARFDFEGRTFTFPPNNGTNFIHGLVRSLPWKSALPTVDESSASLAIELDWDESRSEFASFPIRHRLTVTYTLDENGIRIAYQVENRDTTRLPFGFGLHPWFRVPGDRDQVFIRVAADERMDAEDKLPTGALVPVEGTRYDLRKPGVLTSLELDDVFIGMSPVRGAEFEIRDHGVRVDFRGSREFTHLVVYTPPGQPFFCIENQTSSTDAHNLWARGFRRESNLQVVEPGAVATGYVEWTVDRFRPSVTRVNN